MGEQVDAGILGGLAQLGEHLPCKQGVESSNLLSSTRMMKRVTAQMRKSNGRKFTCSPERLSRCRRAFEECP